MEKINLTSLSIEGMAVRRAMTGAQIFEIGGPENVRKADALAERLREILKDKEGVRITRPTQTTEVRIRDLDDSVESADSVVAAVASAGGYRRRSRPAT